MKTKIIASCINKIDEAIVYFDRNLHLKFSMEADILCLSLKIDPMFLSDKLTKNDSSFDISTRPNLQVSLNGCFHLQISGEVCENCGREFYHIR